MKKEREKNQCFQLKGEKLHNWSKNILNEIKE